MAAHPQEPQSRHDAVAVAEQVGDHDHEAAPRQCFGEAAEGRQERRGVSRARPLAPRPLEHLDHAREMRPLRPCRHARADPIVEHGAAHRIAVREREPGQARGERGGTVVLAESAAAADGLGLVVHARRAVHHERESEVRLLLELLHVEPVLPPPDLPVHPPRIVATDILAVLEELDRLPLVGALVQARERALDDGLGAQFQPRDAGDRLRMQKSSGIWRHASGRPLGPG